jgi:signal-transduction protein with cAMP-binding, CBS, and nucleotidyltransferase domain
MRDKAVGALIVTRDGNPVGIATDRDLLTRVVAEGKDPATTTVSEIMSEPLLAVTPETSRTRVVELMSGQGVRRVPVLQDGKLVGVVALDDLFVELSEELSDLAEGNRLEVAFAQRAARARDLRGSALNSVWELGESVEHLGAEAKEAVLRELDRLRECIRHRRD